MSSRATFPLKILVFLANFLWISSSWAWIETQVRGHSARVEVAADGSAIVRHELQLKIRGGPMKSLEMSGIGTDIEALPDAYVRRAAQGSAGRWPVHLSSMEDGALRLKVGAERGLRGGNYVFVFGYQTSLSGKGIEVDRDRVFVSWVGPRLSSGVDSAKVTFVIPHGQQAPMLAPSTDGLNENVLLGEVRRGAEFDEVDLIRAHLSTGEPAVWRIAVSPEVLGGLPSISPARSSSTTSHGSEWGHGFEPKSRWELSRQNWWIVVGSALFYAFLLLGKAISVVRLGALCDAKVLPLIPMHPVARSLLGAGFVGGLVWAILLQRLAWALGFLTLALLVATFLLPVRRVKPRGPGHWMRVEAPARAPRASLPGAWFDVRSPKGCLLLLFLLGSLVACSYVVLPQSNYLALMTLLGLPLLLPIFWTGNRRDFPGSPVAQALPWQRYLARALDSSQAVVEMWGRAPAYLDRDVSELDAAKRTPIHWDEVRVRLVIPSAPSGLRAVEVVLEEKAGAHVAPCVLVRTLEDSVALRRLPSDIPWQRGRSSEERVALLRPTAPTPAQTARLVKLLVKALQHGQVASSNTARKSSGRGQVSAARPAVGIAM